MFDAQKWIDNEFYRLSKKRKTYKDASKTDKRIAYGYPKETLVINNDLEWLINNFEHMLNGNFGEFTQYRIGQMLKERPRGNKNANMWDMFFCDLGELTPYYATILWDDLSPEQQEQINIKLDDLFYDNSELCKDKYTDYLWKTS